MFDQIVNADQVAGVKVCNLSSSVCYIVHIKEQDKR